MCPCLKNGNTCGIAGTTKSGYDHQTYCLSSSKFSSCPNWQGASEQRRHDAAKK
ncbi:MAG: hypothetical protein FWC15_03290 [Fibromonadales bacterium]|nr:hypothetical protein [Fibromonadales bacterium]